MGAGNRYTLEENRDFLAYQFDVSCDCWQDETYDCDCAECEIDFLREIIMQLPIVKKYGFDDSRMNAYYGDSYLINLEYNHNGDAIVIGFSYQDQYSENNLLAYNYERSYNKLIKHINKSLPLFVGHGYTRSNYAVNEIK